MLKKIFSVFWDKGIPPVVATLLVLIVIPGAAIWPLDLNPEAGAAARHYFDQWLQVTKNTALSENERHARQLKIVAELFDLERISRQLIPNDWAKLLPYTRNRFINAVQEALVREIVTSPVMAPANRPLQLVPRDAEEGEDFANITYAITGNDRNVNILIYMARQSDGTWKITNLKWDKNNSLLRHLYQFCKNILDDYPVTYLIAELGNYGEVVLEDFEDGIPGQFPPDWTWKSKDDDKRKPYVVERENGNKFLRATDRGESVIIGKIIKWNLKKYPYVSFKWRAHRLPVGGDERYGKTVDSAAGIYFIYRKKLGLIPESVKYVWSTTLPVGSAMRRNGVGKPWMVVAESGAEHLGKWRTYTFNAYEAYRKTFGGDPPDDTVGIGILSDANSTHSEAFADYDDIVALRTAEADSGVREILEAE